jgi:hypothetical protein
MAPRYALRRSVSPDLLPVAPVGHRPVSRATPRYGRSSAGRRDTDERHCMGTRWVRCIRQHTARLGRSPAQSDKHSNVGLSAKRPFSRHADPPPRRPSRKFGLSRGRSFCASHNTRPAGQRPLSQGAGFGPLACTASVRTVAVDAGWSTGPGGSFAEYSTKPSCRQKLKRRMRAR